MAERTTEGQRIEFYRRNIGGESYAEIARRYGVSLECVRYWCRKQKKGEGIKSRWHIPKRGALSQFDLAVAGQIIELRKQHPRWGPVSLRIHLEKEAALKGKHLPSPASIGRYLHEDPENWRRPKRKPPELPSVTLTHTHQRWQIDFKVRIHLRDKETVQLHTVTDPFSGAHIGAYLYPSGANTSRVPLQDVQATLRACFAEWGTLPEEIQTDGEPGLAANPGELPTEFTLWLAGLGVGHRKIAAGRPTQNGSVERGHRTINDYSLHGQLNRSRTDLQTYLHQCRQELNTLYPSRAKGCVGRPPLTAHPELLQPRQAYRPEWEELRFDLTRTDALLAACILDRKVGKKGQITIGGPHEKYLVGEPFAGQYVQIHFDPATRNFVAYLPDAQGQLQEIRRFLARNVDASNLLWPGCSSSIPQPQQLALPFSSPDSLNQILKQVYY